MALPSVVGNVIVQVPAASATFTLTVQEVVPTKSICQVLELDLPNVRSHSIVVAPVTVPQASGNFESNAALVALALGIVSSLALTELRSESIANAVISQPVALPTTVCSVISNASGVSSASAFKIVLALNKLAATFSVSSSSIAVCTVVADMLPDGLNDTDDAVVLTVPAAIGKLLTVL